MGSGAMIYIPSFIKIGPGIQSWRRIHRQRGDLISLLLFLQNKESRLRIHRQHGDLISLLLFLQNKESRLRTYEVERETLNSLRNACLNVTGNNEKSVNVYIYICLGHSEIRMHSLQSSVPLLVYVHSPPWKINNWSTNKQLLHFLCNPMLHCRVQRSRDWTLS
jgi:hypothetical protein